MQEVLTLIAEIPPDEVAARLRNKERLTIVDVRELEEVELGMIDQALHIPLFELPERLHELDAEAEIVFVCRSGRRSLVACKVLSMQGFRNVKNMTGGMLAYPANA